MSAPVLNEITDRDVAMLRSWLRMTSAAVSQNVTDDDCCGEAIVTFLRHCSGAAALPEHLAKAVALDEMGEALTAGTDPQETS